MKTVGLDEQQVRLAVIALREYTLKDKAEAKANHRQQQLLAEEEPIRLIIAPWTIPNRAQSIKVWLPNPIRSETAEVCLFTKDVAASAEETERHYRKLLDSLGVKSITKVMAFNTLKKEYKAYEAKRKLASSFELFLTDSRIARLLPSHIGKHFYKMKKAPMSVNMKATQLNAEIQRFVGGTRLQVSNKGSCSSVHVAHIGMNVDMVTKNIMAANASIIRKFPMHMAVSSIIGRKGGGCAAAANPLYVRAGICNLLSVPPIAHLLFVMDTGWKNVKMVHLKTKRSIALPIYMSLPKQLFGVALKNMLQTKKMDQNNDNSEQEKVDAPEDEVSRLELSMPKKKAKLKDQHEDDCVEGNSPMIRAISSAKASNLDSTKTMGKSLKSKKNKKTPRLKGSPSEPRGTERKLLGSPNSSTPTLLLSRKVDPPKEETVPKGYQSSVQNCPKSLTNRNLDCSEMESLSREVKVSRDLYSELEVEDNPPPDVSYIPFSKTPRPVKSKKTPQSSKSEKSGKSFKLKDDIALASRNTDVQPFDAQSPQLSHVLSKSRQKLQLELERNEAKSPIAEDEELVMEIDARNYPSSFSVVTKSVSPKLIRPNRARKHQKGSTSFGFEETVSAPLEIIDPSPKSAQTRGKAELDRSLLLRTPKPAPDSGEDDPKVSDIEKPVSERSQSKSKLESFTVPPKTSNVQQNAKSPRACGSLSKISPMTLRSGKKKMGGSDVKLLTHRSERKLYCSPFSNPFTRSPKSAHKKIGSKSKITCASPLD